MRTLGFIGAGNMAEAIIKGIINAENIYVSDINKERLDYIKEKYNVSVVSDNKDLVNNSDIIILAIKPQVSEDVLNEIKGTKKKIISIMAGKRIDFIKSILGQDANVVRVMPNTPALVNKGMSVICSDSELDKEYKEYLENIFKAIGEVLFLAEDNMDIVTAISGSGPAYIFNFADIMIKSAVQNGLSQEQAELLVKQTFLGSSELMLQSSDTPSVLRDKVKSPGGTTEAALNFFEENNIGDIVVGAINKAKERSKQLSN